MIGKLSMSIPLKVYVNGTAPSITFSMSYLDGESLRIVGSAVEVELVEENGDGPPSPPPMISEDLRV